MLLTSIIIISVALEISKDYKFSADYDRRVGFYKLDEYVIGTIDRYGEFHQQEYLKPNFGLIRYSGPPYAHLDSSVAMTLECYELRSGVLIPGKFSDDKYFVPDIKKKMINFDDYKYNAFAPPIWNLPGKFEKK